MEKKRSFISSDRYVFDFDICRGWQQWDNVNDAWYFGHWLNIDKLQSVSYCEGDVCRTQYDSLEEFLKDIKRIFDGEYGFTQIDVGIGKNRESLLRKYKEAGLEAFAV